MNICIVTHRVDKGDGQGRVTYEIAKEIIRRGFNVILIASYIDSDLQILSSVQFIEIRVEQWPSELLRNLAFSFQAARWLKQNQSQYEFVFSNGSITSYFSDINTAHFVHTTWLSSPHHTIHYRRDLYGIYQWLYTALNAHWEKQAFQKARKVIAVSPQVQAELLSLDLPSSKLQVILNGVDIQEFQPGIGNRQFLGLAEDLVLGLFVGDIRTPRKNLDTVLQAMVKVPKLHLAVAGDTADSPYPTMAQLLGLQGRVHFLGYRRDIPKLMQAADLFIFPSRYETFGLVVLEAMASGLPVITAATTGASELVTPESGSVISHPDNLSELEKALEQLIGDTELRQQKAIAARKTACQHTWIKVAQQYVDLLEELVPHHSSSHSRVQTTLPK